MKSLLLDTNAYTAFKKNDPAVVAVFRKYDKIGVDVTVLGELYAGFSLGNREKQNRQDLIEFLESSRLEIIEHNSETAEVYAQVFKQLRKAGTPIPTNDIWIAAVARQHGFWLLSLDKHFSSVAGLLLADF